MNKNQFERVTGKQPIHFIKEKQTLLIQPSDSNKQSSHSLYNQIITSTKRKRQLKISTIPTEPYYTCNQCNIKVLDSDKQSHQSSLSHQLLDTHNVVVPVSYPINASNKGYALLAKDGWELGKGLGKEETGQKYPIATTFKINRTGLGVEKGRKRITHSEVEEEIVDVRVSTRESARINTINEKKRMAVLSYLKNG